MAVTSTSQPAGLPPEVLALRNSEGANGKGDFERTLTDSTKVEEEEHDAGKDATSKKGSSIADKLKLKLFGKGGSSAAGTSTARGKKSASAAEAEHQHTATQQQERQQQQQQAVADWAEAQGPFEGPEKLLELWFADSVEELLEAAPSPSSSEAALRRENSGLKAVAQKDWEAMLDIVKCKVLSVIKSEEADAYLLSESSMFVFPHKIILKTCGTTTLLLGLQRLLELATSALSTYTLPQRTLLSSSSSGLHAPAELGKSVLRCFYSRKSFMFPERQIGPHRDWMSEVAMLDSFFAPNGAAYTVGKMNGDHWLLYMASPAPAQEADPAANNALGQQRMGSKEVEGDVQDQTLEILMTQLSPASCARYYFDNEEQQQSTTTSEPSSDSPNGSKGQQLGLDLSSKLGLTDLFAETQIDAFAFEPCGFSANAVVLNPNSSGLTTNGGGRGRKDGYWTIHVTPEEGSSYASFETNVALGVPSTSGTAAAMGPSEAEGPRKSARPTDLTSLIQRVINTFEPGKMSITLFVSSDATSAGADRSGDIATQHRDQTWSGNSSVLHKLQVKGYRRTDRIAYEFEGYDLVFVSFEKVQA